MSWLAETVDLPAGVTAEQIATDLARVGIEEETIHGGEIVGPIVVGRVLTRVGEPQKNGKTIEWCSVDVGPEHAADDGGPRGIVCGAHNFDVDDDVVVALPGASLPTPDGPFVISARKTYGHVSDGMICSQRELGLGDDHTGIIVLADLGLQAEPGTDALALFGLGERTVEVNVTPDRGYCFSIRGIGREYAHAIGATAGYRDPADLAVPEPTGDAFSVQVHDEAPINGTPGCDRFVTRVVRGIDPSAPSPAWLSRRLTQSGMRPISLAVDITNYVMLHLGQPLHAYDLNTLADEGITVRRARPGETLTTLDDVTRTLHPEDLLITDGAAGQRVIGLAGVMGGASTEVSATTTDILVEAAHFDPISIARTARRHKLPSEASRRFERGVDPLVCAAAAEMAVRMLVEYGGGSPGAVGDLNEVPDPRPVTMPADLPARLVGVQYNRATVVRRLREIGCDVDDSADPQNEGAVLTVTPPSWRPDLLAGADLVEEVARLEGYQAIPSVLPVAPPGRGLTRTQRGREAVARSLAEAGWSQVLTYPFTGTGVFHALGLADGDPRRFAAALANPLSDEAPLMTTTLLATLPEALRRNISRGASDVALFEVGTVTRPTRLPDLGDAQILPVATRPSDAQLTALQDAVPPQPLLVAGIAAGRMAPAGWWGPGRAVDHTDAIAAALLVGRAVGVRLRAESASTAPWHPGRCARLVTASGAEAGHAGELHPKVCERLDLPVRTVAFELDLDELLAAAPGQVAARPISTQPVVKEDIALIVDESVPSADLAAALREGGGALLESVRLFDVYTGEQVGAGRKSLAFNLRMRATDRTLTSQQSAQVRRAAVAAAQQRFGAELRGS
jgi:phenylalanyl-tRNA synthetase beta chain